MVAAELVGITHMMTIQGDILQVGDRVLYVRPMQNSVSYEPRIYDGNSLNGMVWVTDLGRTYRRRVRPDRVIDDRT